MTPSCSAPPPLSSSGLELSFWQGQYPKFIGDQFEARTISYLMITIGVAEVIGNVTIGRLSGEHIALCDRFLLIRTYVQIIRHCFTPFS